MQNTQANELATTIAQFWPIWSPAERQSQLRRKLLPLDYGRASQGIDDMTDQFKGMPSWADFAEYIMRVRIQIEGRADCTVCENTGWVIVDETGQGTAVKCECGGGHEKKFYDQKDVTSEGYRVATLEEAYAGILTGFEKARPDWNHEQVMLEMDKWFPDIKARFEQDNLI